MKQEIPEAKPYELQKPLHYHLNILKKKKLCGAMPIGYFFGWG